MKNPREYTNQDPLVKAAYDVITAKKAMEAAEAAAKLEEAVKPKGGFEFTVDIGGIDYKTQLDRVVKLIKKTRILKSDKDITSFLESGLGRELGEIIVGQHARLSPAARKNDAPLTSFLSKKLPIWDAMEESTELEEGLGFADSSQGAKQAYKNTLSLSKSLKKGSSLNKAVNKRLEGKYDSDFVKMEDAIELILSTLDEIDREYQMNEGTDVAEWKEKSLWAEGALSLPNEKELAMAITQLNFLCHASMEIRNHLMNGGGFPEWFQNKFSGVHEKIKTLHAYMEGERQQQKDRKMMVSMKDAKDDYFESLENKLKETLDVCSECGNPSWTTLEMTDQEIAEGERHGNSKIYDKCWKGYRKVPGKKAGEPGSCKKVK